MTGAPRIRPSVSGNFRPIDHAMKPVAPTSATDLALAARHVHRIGARLAAAPPEVAEVLAALGLTRTEPRRAT